MTRHFYKYSGHAMLPKWRVKNTIKYVIKYVINVVCCVGRVEIQIELWKGWCTAVGVG